MRERIAAFIDRTICFLIGHRWSTFGDEDSAGFFADPHTGDVIRSCTRCFHIETLWTGPGRPHLYERRRSE